MLVCMTMVGRRELNLQGSKRRQSTKHAIGQRNDVIVVQVPEDNLKRFMHVHTATHR